MQNICHIVAFRKVSEGTEALYTIPYPLPSSHPFLPIYHVSKVTRYNSTSYDDLIKSVGRINKNLNIIFKIYALK